MNKTKEIFDLLKLKSKQPFEIIKPTFEGIYRLTDKLYIQKQVNDNIWISSQFQLCDLVNGTLSIRPMLTFDLAPKNPNVNGIYYDEQSYYDALCDYFKNENYVYSCYDNDTDGYESKSKCIVGKILKYNEDINNLKDSVTVKMCDRTQFISPEDYVIGFKVLTKGVITDEVTHDKKYIIDTILYSTLINKEFI